MIVGDILKLCPHVGEVVQFPWLVFQSDQFPVSFADGAMAFMLEIERAW